MTTRSRNSEFASRRERAKIASKDLLARLMSRENLTIEHSSNAQSAAFDTKTRHLILPMYKGMSDTLRTMLTAHEVGHAREGTRMDPTIYAKIDAQNPKRVQKYLNIVEDVRIERRMKDLYPGLREMFAKGYKELVDSGNFTNLRPEQLPLLSFIDRLNIHAKLGFLPEWHVPFTAAEAKLVERCYQTTTFEDAVALTQEIYDFQKNQQEQNSGQGAGQPKPGEGEGEGEGKPSKSKSKSKSDQTGQSSQSGKSDKSEKSEPGESGKPSSGSSKPSQSGSNSGSSSKGKKQDSFEEETSMSGGDIDSDESDSDESDSDGSENDSGDSGESEGDSDSDGDSETDESDSDSDGDAEGTDGDPAPEMEGETDGQTDHDSTEGGKSDTIKPGAANSITRPGQSIPGASVMDSTTEEMLDASALAKDTTGAKSVNVVVDWKSANLENIVFSVEEVQNSIENARKFDAAGSKKASENYAAWSTEIRPDINFMVQEFERRKAAVSYARQRESEMGRIDPLKLHQYRTSDNIFKKTMVEHKGKNHGMVMLIDWSGSMAGCLESTFKQVIALSMYCQKIRVPFEVYAFTTSGLANTGGRAGANKDYRRQFTGANVISEFAAKYGTTAIRPNAVAMFQILKSNVAPAKLRRHLENCFYVATQNHSSFAGMGGTPLTEAVLASFKIISEFRAKHRVEIMNLVLLSDGDGGSVVDYGNNAPSYYGSSAAPIVSFRDHTTKHAVTYQADNATFYRQETEGLLKLLSDLTNTNVMGFYLTSGDVAKEIRQRLPKNWTGKPVATLVNEFRNECHVALPAPGYKEFYLVPSSALRITGSAGQVQKALSIAKAEDRSAALKEVATNTRKSRVLLSKFVTAMSRDD